MTGIEINNLKVHTDNRGWLVEVLRSEHTGDHIKGQFYVTVAKPGITKANHYHKRKTEWFCVIKGEGLLKLKNLSSGKEEDVTMGEKNMVTVRIPPNIVHSIKNTGNDDMFLLAYISETFNADDPDTYTYEL